MPAELAPALAAAVARDGRDETTAPTEVIGRTIDVAKKPNGNPGYKLNPVAFNAAILRSCAGPWIGKRRSLGVKDAGACSMAFSFDGLKLGNK